MLENTKFARLDFKACRLRESTGGKSPFLLTAA
jgi:hypothetical protein